MLTVRAFAKNNITNPVVVAKDGEEALAYLMPADGGPPLRPAIVLLDVKLPKIDGLEVLRRIRSSPLNLHLPVIMLTTSNEESDVVMSYELGANSYVRKPVEFSEFIEAARMLGMYWLLLNQPLPVRDGDD